MPPEEPGMNELGRLVAVRCLDKTVIKGLTKDEVLSKIIELGRFGIALSQETLNDIMSIVEYNKYEPWAFIDEIANRELKGHLYDYYEIVPNEPTEYLRYVVGKLTDESLLIKSNELIEKIRASNGKFLDHLLKNAPDDLASIFFRFKPLFLAMKSISRNKTFFNRLRKKAKLQHKPLPPDYMNGVTSMIKNEDPKLSELKARLKGASIFRKIRLAYALNYRLNDPDSIVYRIRNGKGWVADFQWPKGLGRQYFEIALESICEDVKRGIKDIPVYIPDQANYALPATEKQFTGPFPTGSSVQVEKDMIVGIHWTNTSRRIDLDLSVIDMFGGKFGWDSRYRSKGRKIMFSGDMTDARPPLGAAESFYIASSTFSKLLMVNFYNFREGDAVDMKLFVAHEKPDFFEQNYMVDPNNIIAAVNLKIDRRQNILGLIHDRRFYFGNIYIGNSITARDSKRTQQARKYLFNNFVNSIDLKEILNDAGYSVTPQKPSDGRFIDLSPTNIEKASIINLLKKAE
jgi:hypothetical protein